MIAIHDRQSNTSNSNSPFKRILSPEKLKLLGGKIQPKPFKPNYDYSQIRLSPLAYRILSDIDAITNKYYMDYGYIPSEIVNRYKNKGIKTSNRQVERALHEIQVTFRFVESCKRKNLPAYGKEKFRGKYRCLNDDGKAFLLFSEKAKAQKIFYRQQNANKPPQKTNLAELMAELNAPEATPRKAYPPLSNNQCLENIRSSLDYSSIHLGNPKNTFLFYQEYEETRGIPMYLSEPEKPCDPIYKEIPPQHRELVKSACKAAGLDKKHTEKVIAVIVYKHKNEGGIYNIDKTLRELTIKEQQFQKERLRINPATQFKTPLEVYSEQECIERRALAKQRMRVVRYGQ